MLGDHLGDPGPVQRQPVGGERDGDLVDGVAIRTQLDDPCPGGVLTRRALGPGGDGEEELLTASPEVPDRGVQCRRGVTEPLGDHRRGLAVVQVGPQGFVPALAGVGWGREELTSRSHPRLRAIR
jgi:hypothetical protein